MSRNLRIYSFFQCLLVDINLPDLTNSRGRCFPDYRRLVFGGNGNHEHHSAVVLYLHDVQPGGAGEVPGGDTRGIGGGVIIKLADWGVFHLQQWGAAKMVVNIAYLFITFQNMLVQWIYKAISDKDKEMTRVCSCSRRYKAVHLRVIYLSWLIPIHNSILPKIFFIYRW